MLYVGLCWCCSMSIPMHIYIWLFKGVPHGFFFFFWFFNFSGEMGIQQRMLLNIDVVCWALLVLQHVDSNAYISLFKGVPHGSFLFFFFWFFKFSGKMGIQQSMLLNIDVVC